MAQQAGVGAFFLAKAQGRVGIRDFADLKKIRLISQPVEMFLGNAFVFLIPLPVSQRPLPSGLRHKGFEDFARLSNFAACLCGPLARFTKSRYKWPKFDGESAALRPDGGLVFQVVQVVIPADERYDGEKR